MKRLFAAGLVVVSLALVVAGCSGRPSYPVYLCPRCGPTSSGVDSACAVETGHRIQNSTLQTWDSIPTCQVCGEMVDVFTDDDEGDFLNPVVVTCEATGKTIAAVRETSYPWGYTCPACGRPVIRRHREEK